MDTCWPYRGQTARWNRPFVMTVQHQQASYNILLALSLSLSPASSSSFCFLSPYQIAFDENNKCPSLMRQASCWPAFCVARDLFGRHLLAGHIKTFSSVWPLSTKTSFAIRTNCSLKKNHDITVCFNVVTQYIGHDESGTLFIDCSRCWPLLLLLTILWWSFDWTQTWHLDCFIRLIHL